MLLEVTIRKIGISLAFIKSYTYKFTIYSKLKRIIRTNCKLVFGY